MDTLNEILSSPAISLELFLSTFVLFFLSIALYFSVYILLKYKKDATSSQQYELEKKSFLLSSIVKISLIVYIFLFGLFAFSIDDVSALIPGAMCGAGVVGSGEFGTSLVALKFIAIILSMLWISIDIQDQKGENFPYFQKKLYFFLFLYFLLFLTWLLEVNFFMSLSMEEPVLCCSNIYKADTNSFLFGMDIVEVVVLFYATYLSILISTYLQKRTLLFFLSIVFLYLAYISIVYFFSTYIYELPTHKCPYCILSKEYYFIGYFIYASLIIATYYALYGVMFSLKTKTQKKIVIAYSVFIFLISLKYIYYYLINNTLL
jgi:hypothetical protein